MKVEIRKIYNLPQHSFLLLLCASEALDPCIFVVKDNVEDALPQGSSSSSSSSLSSSSPTSLPPGSSSSAVPEEEEDMCRVFPDRVLIAIASLEDMLYAPKGSPGVPGQLYRASAVAMMFKSKEALEQTLEEVVQDVKVLSVLLRLPVITFETVEVLDDNDTVDDDTIYWIPEI